MRGRLVINANELNLEVEDIGAAGIPIGAITQSIVEKRLNPIIDLSELPIPARFTSVTVSEAAVLLAATGTNALN